MKNILDSLKPVAIGSMAASSEEIVVMGNCNQIPFLDPVFVSHVLLLLFSMYVLLLKSHLELL